MRSPKESPMKNLLRSLAAKSGYRILTEHHFSNLWPLGKYGSPLEPYLQKILRDPGAVRTCVDVGANVGQTALTLARMFPAAAIHSFEPVSSTYAQLCRAVAAEPRVRTYPLAMGEQPGEAEIHLAADSQQASLVASEATHRASAGVERIRISTLDAWADENRVERIDFLKTDTEGFDLAVLRGAGRLLSEGRVDLVYAEVSFDANDAGHSHFPEMLAYLAARRFRFAGLLEAVYHHLPPGIAYANALFAREDTSLLGPWKD